MPIRCHCEARSAAAIPWGVDTFAGIATALMRLAMTVRTIPASPKTLWTCLLRQ
jgi:hypothetical protein